MPTFTLKHEINCDEDTFWKIFVDREFNDTLYKSVLEFPEFEIIEQTETETKIARKAKGSPKMNMPAAVTKLLGSGNFGYLEEGSLDKATKIWRFKITPTKLADKMKNEGTVRIESAGAGKIRRVVDLVIEAKMFGVGGMIESAAEKSMREGWDKSAVYMNDWLAKKKA
jgi:hypothetical protein